RPERPIRRRRGGATRGVTYASEPRLFNPMVPDAKDMPGRRRGRLACVLDAAQLADERHADFTGILHLAFDFPGDVAGQLGADLVVDELGIDDDPHFAAGLDGVGLADAF